ncbi:proton-associated sugar transporter A-like isoform X1 [Bradysia coprophila]|uniref:proton-associated sugar transporter A-like isoform X1 n=1 Tax=Bradysia coprophila TaxID=38358 RepID=UPI00187D9EED|nr:proton-associated sugar transporter A-like isoform X1 [Bradysia coprophila]
MNILQKFYTSLLDAVSKVIRINEPVPINYDATRQQMQKIREEHARNQDYDYSHIFRKKSQMDLIRVSFIVVGLEFAYAAETAFTSPTLLEIGVEHKHMTFVWSLSPFLALVFSPILATISDKCRLHYGRRRPMILTFTVLIITGLLLFCFGKSIGIALGDESINSESVSEDNVYHSHYYKYAAMVTICATILLDFSADIIIFCARIYLLDVCVIDDHARGLSVFSMMAGVGGFFGYSSTGIDWEKTMIGKLFGGNVETVFGIVIILISLSSIVSLTSFREIPLPLMEKDELLRPLTHTAVKQEVHRKRNTIEIVQEVHETEHYEQRNGDVEIQIPLLKSGNDENTSLTQYLRSIFIMPRLMQILCLTNLLSWMAFVSYALYFTDFVGEAVFMGDPMAPPDTESLTLYQSGVRFGCFGLAVFALSCSIYSMFIEASMNLVGVKFIYVGSLTLFGVSMFLLATFPTQLGVLVLSVPAGIIYSTMLTIPFLLMTKYHGSELFLGSHDRNKGSSNCRGLGMDMAVLSSSTCISQVVVSLIAGSVIEWIGSSSATIYLAGVLGLVSAFSASKISYLDME